MHRLLTPAVTCPQLCVSYDPRLFQAYVSPERSFPVTRLPLFPQHVKIVSARRWRPFRRRSRKSQQHHRRLLYFLASFGTQLFLNPNPYDAFCSVIFLRSDPPRPLRFLKQILVRGSLRQKKKKRWSSSRLWMAVIFFTLLLIFPVAVQGNVLTVNRVLSVFVANLRVIFSFWYTRPSGH